MKAWLKLVLDSFIVTPMDREKKITEEIMFGLIKVNLWHAKR